jgi:hypothetical protein
VLSTGVAAFVTERPVSVWEPESSDTAQVLEIRSYNLKPGTRERFHQRFLKEALPMLRRAKIDVVSYGPSLHDDNSYFLMRAFPGVKERQASEDVFYGSDEWKKGPREAVLADIDSYTTVVIAMDAATIKRLRTRRESSLEK